jgi:hypothetical protein
MHGLIMAAAATPRCHAWADGKAWPHDNMTFSILALILLLYLSAHKCSGGG